MPTGFDARGLMPDPPDIFVTELGLDLWRNFRISKDEQWEELSSEGKPLCNASFSIQYGISYSSQIDAWDVSPVTN